MNTDESTELFNASMKDIVDRIYGEQYAELFPDIDPPIESLDALKVGDIFLDSDEFISTVIDSYQYEAEMVGGTLYQPPKISDIVEFMKQSYEAEIELLEDEGVVEEGTAVSFVFDEASVLGQDIAPRVAEVLDVLELTYIGEEYVKYFDYKTGKMDTTWSKRIMNTSTTNLFDFDFKNVWIDRGNKTYDEAIQEGYNNLLRINMGDIW